MTNELENEYDGPSFELVLTRGRSKPISTKAYSGEALAQWYEHQLQKELNVDPIEQANNKPKKKNKKAPKKHTLENVSNKTKTKKK